MWYEIIPSVAIVWGLLMIPPVATTGLNYLFFNGKTVARRWFGHPEDFHGFLRDQRISGSEYVLKGLEGVPKMD